MKYFMVDVQGHGGAVPTRSEPMRLAPSVPRTLTVQLALNWDEV
jgi:hypothetical protein